MKKFFILFLITASMAFAQSAGNSGLSFLKIGFGARNIAMGDVGTTVSNDVSALFYNPARLAGKTGNEILLMHNQWIQDVRSELLGVKTNLFGLPFALGLNVTNVGNIEVRTKPGDPLTTFDANYFFGSLSTGFFISNNLSFGLSAKYLYEGIFVDESTGWGLDFGLNYNTSIKGLSASAVIKNLGSMNKLRVQKTKLPTEIRFGPAYRFSIPDSKFDITTAVEFQKYTATNDSHLDVGAEIVYNKLFALRGGYQSGYIAKNFSGGIGIMWGSFDFDYAFSPFSYDLGSGHSISLNFKF